MKNRVYESMVRLTVGPWTIRVWRTEGELLDWTNADLQAWATERNAASNEWAARPVPFGKPPTHDPRVLFAEIETFDRIAAVEILAKNGSGFLLYPDWK